MFYRRVRQQASYPSYVDHPTNFKSKLPDWFLHDWSIVSNWVNTGHVSTGIFTSKQVLKTSSAVSLIIFFALSDSVPSYNLKNTKNTHGGVLLFVKLQAKKACNFIKSNTPPACTLLKVTLFHGFFSCFLYCTNGTKSRKTSHIQTLTRNNSTPGY